MLIEQLFSQGIMTMGPSRFDPQRQVGVFSQDMIRRLSAARTVEMDKFRWIAGEWCYENLVPATRLSPAYSDAGNQRFAFCEADNWVCGVSPNGSQVRQITFDPFSKQWIYVLTRGSYGILRSREGWAGDQIVFSGLMTMIGIDCEWRMTWDKKSDDEFGFVNEEQVADGSWAYIDEWRFRRR
ncbi:MAG: hypothetical protein LAO55_25735 [Acidobacteriia bacterium]|nr:hypothetical protein [Terriglobia bacterium]